ncbi:hypothetical protein TanjilG_23466 [Lupinus angustifolius]|uniref:DUF4408 domain-containing protein n=2 Tax=Lupinus angustifolius TaxID=3871 RepID=A0A4P1R9H6_LUPAN|nr:hypothetical protein TanjilG_23466 [Lupinus angustifolius]
MDSLNFTDMQAEKANAMLIHRKLRRIGSLFRLIEVCVVLVFISRLPMQLPVSFKNSSEYFREFLVFMNSPGFIFLIGNAIIITLFAQSGRFSAHGSKKNNPELGIYHDFIQNNIKNEKVQGEEKLSEKQNIGTEDSIQSEKQSSKTEDSIQSEKQSLKTEDTVKNRRINEDVRKYSKNQRINPITLVDYSINDHGIDAGKSKWVEKQSNKTGETSIGLEVKSYRRCETEILRHVQNDKENQNRVLKRCETENMRKSIQPSVISTPEDHMSNEEFRRTIEAFIAKQQRLLREEEDKSLVYNYGCSYEDI